MMEHNSPLTTRSTGFKSPANRIAVLLLIPFLLSFSLAALGQQKGALCLYSKANFKGKQFCSNTNVSVVPLSFKTASIKLKPGYAVTVFRFPLFFGSSETLNKNVKNATSVINNVGSFKLQTLPESSLKSSSLTGVIQLLLLDEEPKDPNDFDGDGFSNDLEDRYNTDPRDPNSTPPDIDGDKIPDDVDEDRDGDGVNNNVEDERGTNPNDGNDFPDLVAPTLSVSNPSTVRTTSEKILINGSLIEPVQVYSGVKDFFIQSSAFDGAKFLGQVNASSGAFAIEVPLVIGLNTITVFASDNSGNQSREVINVTRGAIPSIISVDPASGTVVTNNITSLSGSIRSITGVDKFDVFVNDSRVIPQSSSEQNHYEFNFRNVTLNLGDNQFKVRVTSDFGADQQNIIINYRPESADELGAPTITNISPSNERTLNQSSFRVGAQIDSVAGPLTVKVNGNEVLNKSEGLTFYALNELVSFDDGESSVSLRIDVQDSLGKTAEQSLTYYRDLQKPTIVINQALQVVPSVNTIDTSVTQISGLVSDNNLSSFLVNDQPLELSPGNADGEYLFTFTTQVSGDTATNVELAAYDRSGNVTRTEYALLNTASATVSGLLPPANSVFISKDNAAINLQVAARHAGVEANQSIVAYLQSSPQQVLPLNVNGTLASGDLNLPGQVGKQSIVFEVRGPQGQRITSATTAIEVKAAEDIELEVVRVEPENNQAFVEPNAPIEIYFNQTVDLADVSVTVSETLNGKSYINADPLGEDFIRAQGYVLTDINRNRETVPGQVSAIPGSAGVVFAPSRNFGYNAELFVDVKHQGKTFLRSRFQVRQLPTFINGAISDQFGQPLKGIKVEIPELKRSTITNGDGGFAFGYQEAADSVIASGRYRVILNGDFKNPRFGTADFDISVQQNRINSIARKSLQEIDSNTAFATLSSGANNVLIGGDLQIDLSENNARAVFPNSRTSGPVHVQFLPFEHMGVATYRPAMPLWLFSLQPQGISVEGNATLKIKIPKLRGGMQYIDPSVYQYVVMLAYSRSGQVVEPIGVGEIVNGYVESRGNLALTSLDYLGYAQVSPTLNTVLADYVNGKASLQQLKAALQNVEQANTNQVNGG